MDTARQPIVRPSVLAAALATLPYFAINFGHIAIQDGSFIHFSKLEALALAMVFGCALWMVVAGVLVISAWSAHGRRPLFGFAATTAFAVLATAIEPRFWLWFFDLLNGGFAEWIFRTGIIATMLSLVPRKLGRRQVYFR